MSNEHKHKVTNRTARNIWVHRVFYSSPEIPPEASLEIPLNSNVEYKVWGKYGEPPHQKDEEMGNLWIPRDGQATVHNRWHWAIRPFKSAGEQFPVALSETLAIQDDTSNLPFEIEQKTNISYGVINSAGRNISVKRFFWSSGVIVPKEHRRLPADDALEVTIFGQYGDPPNQRDEEMAKVWVPKRGQVIVHDRWSLDVHPLFVRGTGKQSPIALSEGAAVREKSSLEIKWKKDLAGRVVGEGNHVKVFFTDEDRGYFKLNDDKMWTIKEFHLHARAEHPIQGKYAPIELHIVHENLTDKTSAVIGITFERSADLSEKGSGFFADLMERSTAIKAGDVVDMPVKPYDLLPGDHSQYYYYDGSLTTAPFKEEVSWFVMRNPKLLPPKQIDEYVKNYSGTPRDIQPLNFRDLFKNF